MCEKSMVIIGLIAVLIVVLVIMSSRQESFELVDVIKVPVDVANNVVDAVTKPFKVKKELFELTDLVKVPMDAASNIADVMINPLKTRKAVIVARRPIRRGWLGWGGRYWL